MSGRSFSPSSLASAWIGFADDLRTRRGWRRIAAAFVFGALSALAFPPVNLVPLLWLCLPALIFLLQGTQDAKRAFATGWSFAFGFFAFSLYWIADSMFVDIARFWWAVPLAALGLPVFFAIYYGLAAALARRIGLHDIAGIAAFALLWFLADYARGHLFTGFPWNLAGYAWSGILPALQITSVTGIYGLTLITAVCAFLPAALAKNRVAKTDRRIAVGSLIILALMIAWGGWRLWQAPVANVPDVRLRLVQPDTNQATKWKPSSLATNFEELLTLSSAPAGPPITHIIWPETASPYYLLEEDAIRARIAHIIPTGGALITGVLRRSFDAQGKIDYYNSLIAMDDFGLVTGVYDKAHLVPFGEYIPERDFLPLRPLVNLGLDFSHGDGPKTLRALHLPPFSPFICYEAIFPGAVTDPADPPQLLINVTNDGWYGDTAGPYQHFAIARVRAIEEGLPLVRDANTGISGVVDSYGRVRAKLAYGERGFLDSDLPQVASAKTPFSRYGEWPLWALFAALSLAILWTKRRSLKM